MATLRKLCAFVLVAFLLGAAGQGQEHGTAAYAFTNGRWWDGKAFVAKPFYSVNGLLHPNRPYKIDREIDLQGGYVIPACGEAHNHNATGDNDAAIDNYLASGILYVKNPANLPRAREGARINSPRGIDVIFSNGVLTSSGGHPLGLVKRNIERGAMKAGDGEGAFYFTIDSPADLDAKWPNVLASKPDFIKVILVYSEEFEKRKNDDKYFSRRGLDPKLLKPIVQRAHKAGLTVSAHVESATDFHHAVEAGVDEINHMPGFWPADDAIARRDFARYRIAEADARSAGSKHIRVVTTIGESLDSMTAQPADQTKPLLDTYKWNLGVLRRSSVELLVGSDQFRKNARDEALAIAREKLLSNQEVLHAWCEATPKAIFPKRRISKLKDGYEANFVVLRADPLQDFNAAKEVMMTFKYGEQLTPPPKN